MHFSSLLPCPTDTVGVVKKVPFPRSLLPCQVAMPSW